MNNRGGAQNVVNFTIDILVEIAWFLYYESFGHFAGETIK